VNKAFAVPLTLLALLLSCCKKQESKPQYDKLNGLNELSLIGDASTTANWSDAGIPNSSNPANKPSFSWRNESNESILIIAEGQPMAGVKLKPTVAKNIPISNYRIELQARRVEGVDFFCALTFPVGVDPETAKPRHASLIVGGWGGNLVGISSLDHYDASENETRCELSFDTGKWYDIALEVTNQRIAAWIEGKAVVNVGIVGRHVSLRPGDIDHCLPLGLATWRTKGEFRRMEIKPL